MSRDNNSNKNKKNFQSLSVVCEGVVCKADLFNSLVFGFSDKMYKKYGNYLIIELRSVGQ